MFVAEFTWNTAQEFTGSHVRPFNISDRRKRDIIVSCLCEMTTYTASVANGSAQIRESHRKFCAADHSS
jgi:hypothetical protein